MAKLTLQYAAGFFDGEGHSMQWTMNSNKALVFLKLILPYLVVKKPQAEIGIAFQKYKSGWRHGEGSMKAIVNSRDNRLHAMENFRLTLVKSRDSDNSQYTEPISREDLINQEPSTTTRGAA